MERRKKWINPDIERKAFENIIREVFMSYKDNLLCSQDTIEDIIKDATSRIRNQLKGLTNSQS